MDPYGLQAGQLAQACGVSLDTARRWKRLGRIPPVADRLVQWWLRGDLGSIAPAWSGFTLRSGELWTPYGFAVRPGELSALAYRGALIAELQRSLTRPEQWDFLELNEAADRRLDRALRSPASARARR